MPFGVLDAQICDDEAVGKLVWEQPHAWCLLTLMIAGGYPWGRFPARLKALKKQVAYEVPGFDEAMLGELVELLVASQQPALERGELSSLGSGLVLRLALEAKLLVLCLEDQLLLLRARLGNDPSRLVLGALDRLIGDLPTSEEAEARTH